MPTYTHICEKCLQEFEDTYSIHAPIPTVCPLCQTEGQVKRLISSQGIVRVQLEGRELVESLWKEGKDMAKRAKKDDNLAANLYGLRS